MSNQKAKFFAQYWGQKVMCSEVERDPFEINENNLHRWVPECYLELTPLLQISDEDLKAIGFGNIGDNKLQFVFDDYNTNWKSSCGNWGTLLLKDFDYLRSKGYALPFLHFSVNDLINMGWVRLKK